MADKVGSLYYDMTLDNSALKSGLDDSSSDVNAFTSKVSAAGAKIQDSLKVAAVALTAVGVGLTAYAKNATDYTTDLVKSSTALGRQLGVTTTQASQLVAALGRMGISADDASSMFGIFEKNIAASTAATVDNRLATQKLQIQIDQTKQSITQVTDDIKQHGDKTGALNLKLQELNNTLATQQNALKQTGDKFAELGIATVDAQGNQRSFVDILNDTADKFKEMPNGIQKTNDALALFGRSGKDMVKVLNLGSDGIADLEKKADALGLTLTANTIGKINDLVQSQKDLKDQTDAMKIAVGTATAPILTQFNKILNEVVGALISSNSPFKQLTTNVLAFGGPIASGAAAAAGFLGNLSSINMKIDELLIGLSVVTIVMAAVAVVIYEVVKQLGGWNQALKDLMPIVDQVHKDFDIWLGALQPSIEALHTTISTKLIPALQNIWAVLSPVVVPVVKALAYALGVVLLGAIMLIIGGLNGLLTVFAQHKIVIAAIAGALTVALIPALITMITVTIPALITGFAAMAVAGWAAIAPWLPFILIGAAIGAIAFEVVAHWQAVKDFFIGIWNWIVGNWPLLLAIILGPFGIAVGLIIKNWNGILDFFKQVPGWIGSFFGGLANAITAPFRAAFNTVADLWNGTIGKLDFHIPDWIPGIGGKGFAFPKLPKLAEGGVATSATAAIFGEAGPEAVLPISKLNQYSTLFDKIDAAANRAGTNAAQNQQPSNTNITLNMSGIMARSQSDLRDIGQQMIDAVNQKLKAQGKPQLGTA